MLFSMAWRNLWRARRRTGITLFSVAFGTWLAATFTVLADDSYRNMIASSVRLGFGHATVEARGHRDAPGFDHWVTDAEAIADRAAALPEVERAVVRIFGQAMYATARKSVGGILYGVDPSSEDEAVSIYAAQLEEGRMLSVDDRRGVVVGRVLAERLNLALGKKMVVTMVDRKGEMVSEVARVVGIYRTGVDEVDGSVALLPIDQVRGALGYGEGDASLVSIYLDDHRQAGRVVSAIRGQLRDPEVVAETWSTTQPELAGMVRLDRSMNQLFQLLIGLLIAAGVLNTLLMSVLERRREFGVMIALGTPPLLLFRMVLLESAILAGTGLLLAAVVLAPWFRWLQVVGIDTSGLTGEDMGVAGVLVDPILRATIYWESMFTIGVVVFLLTVGAGLYPAWRAGRERPVEMMGGADAR